MSLKILVATDFSPCARAAGQYALELAARLDATLTLLHVYRIPAYPVPDGMIYPGPEAVATLLTESQRSLERERAALATPRGARIDVRATEGNSWEEIVSLARREKYELIVVGTHGRTGLAHLLLGSVAESVVRHASCPVLTVPDPSRAIADQSAA